MLYCPGKGQELLSALGVNLECHASSIFLVLKPPLSIIDALSKSSHAIDFDNAISFSQRSFLNFIRCFILAAAPLFFQVNLLSASAVPNVEHFYRAKKIFKSICNSVDDLLNIKLTNSKIILIPTSSNMFCSPWKVFNCARKCFLVDSSIFSQQYCVDEILQRQLQNSLFSVLFECMLTDLSNVTIDIRLPGFFICYC